MYCESIYYLVLHRGLVSQAVFVAGQEGLQEVVGDDGRHAPDGIGLCEVEGQSVPDGELRSAAKLGVPLYFGIVERVDWNEHHRFDFCGVQLEVIRGEGLF